MPGLVTSTVLKMRVLLTSDPVLELEAEGLLLYLLYLLLY